MNRFESTTTKVKTPFGSMYIHIDLENGVPIGGWISDPGKEPDSQISKLVEDLSRGIGTALDEWKVVEPRVIMKSYMLTMNRALTGGSETIMITSSEPYDNLLAKYKRRYEPNHVNLSLVEVHDGSG